MLQGKDATNCYHYTDSNSGLLNSNAGLNALCHPDPLKQLKRITILVISKKCHAPASKSSILLTKGTILGVHIMQAT